MASSPVPLQQGPRWQRRPDDRRAEILDAAVLAFGQSGYKRTTLADVAERAGISPGTVSHYFGSKAALFEEVIAELADRGITVLLTTHDLAGVETIADRVAIMLDGRIVIAEELEVLKSRFRRVRYAQQPVALGSGAIAMRTWGSGGAEAVVNDYDDLSERFRGAEVAPMSLEEIFIAVAGETTGAES